MVFRIKSLVINNFTDAMRKAIVFTGGINHLLNLLSTSNDEQDLKIYMDTFMSLIVDGMLFWGKDAPNVI